MRTTRPAARMIRTIPAAATASEQYGGPHAARMLGGGLVAFFLTLILAVGLVLAGSLQAFGAPTTSGIDGGCTWTYDDFNQVLTIKPTPGENGTLSPYSGAQRGWLAYADSIKHITVEEGVTARGDMQSLFAGMTVATSILLLPSFDQGITNASEMFAGCRALKSITFPKGFGGSITNAQSMLSSCTALESISLPDRFGGATMQTNNMFDGSPLLSIVYIGSDCNGIILTQVPDAAEGEYLGAWVRLIDDPDVTYDKGKAPSDLQADYEGAGKHKSVYVRQHEASVAPPEPQVGTSVRADTIYMTISVSAPVDVFVSYSLDGSKWQANPPYFGGLNAYTTYDKIQVRYASPAYKNESIATVSATTCGLITYNANGGTGATKRIEGVFGDKSAPAADCAFTAPEAGVLETCTFKEWNASPSGEGARYLPGDPVAFEPGGNTLYAIWEVHSIPRITATDLPAATVGKAYSQKFSAIADAPLTWTIEPGSALPEGLSLAADGILSGTPAAAGSFSFTVEVRNDYGGSDTAEFTLVVTSAVTPINTDDPKDPEDPEDPEDQVGLAATGDAAAVPAAGLVALALACSAGLVSLVLRRRAAKR